MDDRRKKGERPGRRPVHLFTGLTFCACGQKMYVPSNTPKYVCYGCRNKVPTEDLEAVFHEELKSYFLSPTEITRYLEEADHVITEKVELLRNLESEQPKVQAEMDRVYRLYVDDKISADEFGTRYRPLEERKKQLGDQVPELQGEIDFLKIKYLSSDEVLSEAKDLYGRWPELDFSEKRKIVENITEKITVGKDEITIDLCYLPGSSEIMAAKQRDLTGSSPRSAGTPRAARRCRRRGSA
ncbi:MAG: hypothetical protein HYY35_03430 [Deltaproteobacteria bacterium]|nr:hypothetical protein [Deltaproteobacteria bacterium]